MCSRAHLEAGACAVALVALGAFAIFPIAVTGGLLVESRIVGGSALAAYRGGEYGSLSALSRAPASKLLFWLVEYGRCLAVPAATNAQPREPAPDGDDERRVLLAMGMVSNPASIKVRERVRRTMLTLPGFVDVRVAFRFVLGADVDAQCGPADHASADVLMLPGALDGPSVSKQCSCIEKTHGWFVYALRRWPAAAFYAKTEDDTYVNVGMLLADLATLRRAPRVVYGLLHLCASAPLAYARAANGGANRSFDQCYLGDFEALRHGLEPKSMWRRAMATKFQEGGRGCRSGAPMPFPTGPLAAFSADAARGLFAECGYTRSYMELGRERGRAAESCAAASPMLGGSLQSTTCDCVLGNWLEHCVPNATLAHMTWTKGHHYASGAGAMGWVAASRNSIAVHGLKQAGGGWEEAHKASGPHTTPLFPPLVWRYRSGRAGVGGGPDERPRYAPVRPAEHRWYARQCGAKSAAARAASGSAWAGFGCHRSRGWPAGAARYPWPRAANRTGSAAG